MAAVRINHKFTWANQNKRINTRITLMKINFSYYIINCLAKNLYYTLFHDQ